MKKVIIGFRTAEDLSDYQFAVDAPQCITNRERFTMICNLSEADIKVARNRFHATVLESIPVSVNITGQ
ncbi:MAG TPA: hypothetical protein VGB56_14070 [Flavisolibacter sp.]|jgi:hypothetical protein